MPRPHNVWGHVLGPSWDDKPVAIVGNGPSLLGFDLSRLRDRFHILAVKGSIFDCPFADAGFGLDFPRYQEWHPKLMQLERPPIYWACTNFTYIPGPQPDCITFLRRIDQPVGLSDDPGAVHAGGTSGFGAFGVAWHKGAREVILLGYDYSKDHAGRWHYDESPYKVRRGQDQNLWNNWIVHWDAVLPKIRKRKVDVINACPTSAITAFPKMTIEEAINRYG